MEWVLTEEELLMDRDLNQQSHAEHEAKAGIKVPVLELQYIRKTSFFLKIALFAFFPLETLENVIPAKSRASKCSRVHFCLENVLEFLENWPLLETHFQDKSRYSVIQDVQEHSRTDTQLKKNQELLN